MASDAADDDGQDFQRFLARYRREHGDDVLVIERPVSADQDATALVTALAADGRHPLLVLESVAPVEAARSNPPFRAATNVFASRERIARLLGAAGPSGIHAAYQQRARRRPGPCAPRAAPTGRGRFS